MLEARGRPWACWAAAIFLLVPLAAPALGADAGDCPGAGLAACTAAIATAPGSAEKAQLLVERARLLRHGGALEAAESDLAEARALAPDDAGILVELGYLKRAEGDPEAALAAYTRATAIDPQNGRALLNRMDALADLGRYDECLAEAPRALAIAPEQPRTYAYRGRCRAGAGQTALAVEDYHKAAAMGLDEAFLHANLALAELDLGHNAAALAAAQAAALRDPANEYGQYGLIDALFQLGRADEAISAYHRAEAAIETDTLGLANLVAWELYQRGRALDALPIIEAFLAEHPERSAEQAYEVDTYGHILSALGRKDEAVQQFLLAVRLGGPDKDAAYRQRMAALGIQAAPGPAGLAAALGKCAEMGDRCRLSD
jgi:tetratricopeptide (TPR) repeat protein